MDRRRARRRWWALIVVVAIVAVLAVCLSYPILFAILFSYFGY